MDPYRLAEIEPLAQIAGAGWFAAGVHYPLARPTRIFPTTLVRRPPLEVFSLPRGRLFSGYSDFLLLDGTGAVLRRSLHSPALVAAYREACAAGRIIRHPGRVFVIRDMSSARNYCHWLCDWLPRLLMLRRMATGPMTVAFSEELAPFQIGFLRHVPGIEPLMIPWGARAGYDGAVLEADELVFLTSTFDMGHPAYQCDPAHMGLLDSLVDLVGPEAGQYPESIFVSRMRTGRRVLEREDEFIAMLGARGVATVFLEDMDVDEQVRTFAAARNVIGIHGAGLTNLVLARRCRNVVEIFPPAYGTVTFQMLADAIGARYHYWYEGEPDAELLNDETRDRPFIAPLDRLLDAVMSAIASPETQKAAPWARDPGSG